MRFLLCILLFLMLVRHASGEEFTFDASELEKKVWHLGGYAEARPGLNLLDRDAAQAKLRYYDRPVDDVLVDFSGRLVLEGSLEKDWAKLFVQPSLEYVNSRLENNLEFIWNEAWIQLKPSDSFKLLVGKKSLKWGKGYAWNPVAFFDQPKNPDDPEDRKSVV